MLVLREIGVQCMGLFCKIKIYIFKELRIKHRQALEIVKILWVVCQGWGKGKKHRLIGIQAWDKGKASWWKIESVEARTRELTNKKKISWKRVWFKRKMGPFFHKKRNQIISYLKKLLLIYKESLLLNREMIWVKLAVL